jgi:hypothetical protein
LQCGFLQKLIENPPGVVGRRLFTALEDFFERSGAKFVFDSFATTKPATENAPPDYCRGGPLSTFTAQAGI